MKMMKFAGVALAAALLMCGAGCVTAPMGASGEAWTAISNGAPIRVAVYTDKGARSKGMFRWLQHMELSPDVKLTPVDGESIRNGVLDTVDVLVMPGGRATIEARALQTNGLDKVRAFIHRGGSYVGTCAGCFMVMQYARGEHLMPLIPYTFWRKGDKPDGERGPYLAEGDKEIVFNDASAKACGISGTHKIRYAGGPVLWPTGETIPDAKMQTFAKYAPTTKTKGVEGKSIGDCVACVAGTYGKGRLFVLAVHPEANPKNTDVVQGAFKFVTGRMVRFPEQQKDEKALRVGFYCANALGPQLARWAMDLVSSPDYLVEPVTTDMLAEGVLNPAKLPVFVTGEPRDLETQKLQFDSQKGAARVRKYLEKGGKVITWGPAKDFAAFKEPHANLIIAKDAAAARAALEELKK